LVDDIAFRVDDVASKMRSFAEQVRDGAGLLDGPQAQHEDLKQDDVDRMMREGRSQVRSAAGAHQSEAGTAQAATAEPGSGFERPEPLSLAELDAGKRAALFG
jgi:hypothetical protein